MNNITTKLIDPKELQRVSRIELFDEFEEWNLIQAHYCVIVAVQEKSNKDLFGTITLSVNK